MKTELIRRAEAVEATKARFAGKDFDWGKRVTCIHLARFQARQMGHRPPAIPDFRSPVGARTALRKMGHADLEGLMDAMFPRIAPASAWVGDIVMLPGEIFGALVVNAGGALIGFHEAAPGLVNIKEAMADAVAAWRL
jgi:hypothetical protein